MMLKELFLFLLINLCCQSSRAMVSMVSRSLILTPNSSNGTDNPDNSCRSGYVWNEELKECKDEDECQTGNYNCIKYGDGGLCVNVDGSYFCAFIYCDEDEKLVNSTCVPKCETGYRFNPVRDECQNVDECLEAADGRSPCGKGMECVDTPGSYKCRKSICKSGYRERKSWFGFVNCVDIDECSIGDHNCGQNEVCVNTDGSFDCDRKCDDGYRFDPVGEECININECLEAGFRRSPCDEGFNCEDTPGSYNCIKVTCGHGYREARTWMGKAHCVDIDECIKSVHNCTENEVCINNDGSFDCKNKSIFDGYNSDSCPSGFVWNGTSFKCEDVDECQTGNSNCSDDEECINFDGSYKCVHCWCGVKPCVPRFVDECAMSTDNCGDDEICVDTFENFDCVCKSGFKRSVNGSCQPELRTTTTTTTTSTTTPPPPAPLSSWLNKLFNH